MFPELTWLPEEFFVFFIQSVRCIFSLKTFSHVFVLFAVFEFSFLLLRVLISSSCNHGNLICVRTAKDGNIWHIFFTEFLHVVNNNGDLWCFQCWRLLTADWLVSQSIVFFSDFMLKHAVNGGYKKCLNAYVIACCYILGTIRLALIVWPPKNILFT